MTPLHAATRSVAHESLAMLREAVDGLPDAAIDWTPVANMNSLGVLVTHAISSTRFWLRCGSGQQASFLEYRQNERAAAFTTRGVGAAELTSLIDAFTLDLDRILEAGTEEHVAATLSWPGEDVTPPSRTGAQCLVHGIAHLREHVGHAQANRDLWMASSPQHGWR